jgi:HAD superfamily hydrolase (TIGR01509 family)
LVPGVELVIFDCDGVLVDSEAISSWVLLTHLRDAGLTISAEEVEARFLGPRLKDIVAIVEAAVRKELGEAWIRDFEERRAEVFEAELLSMQGAHDSLSCLIENGVAVCVASQGRLEATRQKLELVDLAKFFSPNALFSADEVTHGKPHPDVFLHAAEVMGAEPDRCLVIEDSDLGITAALQAGMRVFEYPGDASAERRAGVRPLPSLSEIPLLLGTT